MGTFAQFCPLGRRPNGRFLKNCSCAAEDAGGVGDAHAVVGGRDAGGNYTAEAVGKLALGDHAAAALECEGEAV